jgi:hypothetical protein
MLNLGFGFGFYVLSLPPCMNILVTIAFAFASHLSFVLGMRTHGRLYHVLCEGYPLAATTTTSPMAMR